MAPISLRSVVPNRSSNAARTSGFWAISSWTISSLEIVAAPWRANATSASLLPAPIAPVIATLSGRFRLVGLWIRRLGLDFEGLGLVPVK